MRLKDKTAIITGAGQGIGLAYAKRFLQEGAKVAIAEINDDRGKSALAECEDLGDVIYVNTDISSPESAANCAETTKDEFGSVDILINTAALYYDIDNENNSLEYLKKVFDVNLHGAWVMTGAVAPYMTEQKWGRVINQSSDAAFMYFQPNMSGDEPKFKELSAFSYSQTKWGVIGLTKFLAGQLGPFNVTVNCICPGLTMTEATKKIVPEEFMGMIPMMSPLGRALEAEDLTGTAVFFSTEDADLITGQVLCVDAGAEMPV